MKKTPSTVTRKLGPSDYRPDVAFTKPDTSRLPKPKLIKQRRNYQSLPCPQCGQPAHRDKVFTRQLHEGGALVSGRPHELQITYSQHYCATCASILTSTCPT